MHGRHLTQHLGGVRLKDFAPVFTGIGIADSKGNRHPAEWDGLIDTGSSRTLIPLDVATDLRMTLSATRLLAGFGESGPMRSYPGYRVRLSIPGLPREFLLTACAVPNRNYILLGRDFINQHVLLIDGRAGTWAISRPSAFLRMALWCLGVRS